MMELISVLREEASGYDPKGLAYVRAGLLTEAANEIERLRRPMQRKEKKMKFEDMNAMQRRLHNAAHVLDADGDENGFVELLREAIDDIEGMRQSLAFYKRRCDALQEWQSKMRDPERTIVCDVLANGCTLPPEHAGDRYKATPNAKVSTGAQTPEEADHDSTSARPLG